MLQKDLNVKELDSKKLFLFSFTGCITRREGSTSIIWESILQIYWFSLHLT